MMQPLWKTVWQFLKQLNIKLPNSPAILLLAIYPRAMKTYVHINVRNSVIPNSQKVEPPKYSIDEWINKHRTAIQWNISQP